MSETPVQYDRANVAERCRLRERAMAEEPTKPTESEGKSHEGVRDTAQERSVANGSNVGSSVSGVATGVPPVVGDQGASAGDKPGDVVVIPPVPYHKHEAKCLELIGERDAAEEALSQAYYLVLGHSPEWSNLFGHKEALEEIEDAVTLLKAAAVPTKPAQQESKP